MPLDRAYPVNDEHIQRALRTLLKSERLRRRRHLTLVTDPLRNVAKNNDNTC